MSGPGRNPPIPDGHVIVGRIVGTHGVRGAVKIELKTDFPQRFAPGNFVFGAGKRYEIQSVSWHKGQARAQISDVNSMEAAEDLKWVYLTVPESELPELDEDEFMADDLVGLAVRSDQGEEYGQVSDVLHYPAHDILVVGDLMIPAISEFILDIDLDKGLIVVKLIPGMGPGEEPEVVQ